MNFLLWHYGTGLTSYLNRWKYLLGWLLHYFSLPLLLLTLFSPWKRLINTNDTPGFSFERWFSTLSYNIVSRVIGAVARLFLFFWGSLLLLFASIAGAVGLIFWLICPLLGLPYYLAAESATQKAFSRILGLQTTDLSSAMEQFFHTPAGKFISTHISVSPDQLRSIISQSSLSQISNTSPTASSVVSNLISSSVWPKESLRSLGTTPHDIQLAAQWWDLQNTKNLAPAKSHYSQPGIGRELLFGYTPTLNKYCSDLSVPQTFAPHLIGREDLVSRIDRILDSGKALVLFGSPGVGKKTVVYEFAHRAKKGELSPSMLYKRVLELDYNVVLSQAFDLNQKKKLLQDMLLEATYAGNVVLVIKDLHRLTSQVDQALDFTDIFEKALETKKLLLIALSAQVEYEKFIATNPRLRKYLEPVEVPPVDSTQATQILMDFASNWEHRKPITITTSAISAIITGSDKYISDTPFPEKSLELLDNVIALCDRKNTSVITADDVNAVIAETTGISLARLNEKEKDLLANLESTLHQRLVGQDAAASVIAKSLRARAVGAKSDNRPLGSFLFLGPTGVGKTETAKTLAKVYYGSEDYILRFDMAEYAGNEGLERLIGSSLTQTPGKLTTEIKNRPASLLLLDEIEKAPPQIFNLFLSLLDEGSITDALGKKINCKNIFVIATSNAGSEYIREQIQKGQTKDALQKQVVEFVQQQKLFSPEFLNRFDSVVVFEPLTPDQTISIANILLGDVVKNLAAQDITLHITPQLATSVATEGYEPQFGARPLRRLIDLEIGDAVGRAILGKQVQAGDQIEIVPQGNKTYQVKKV